MNQEATESFTKATRLLGEASRIDPERSPGAVVHATYYAMYHAARACLLVSDRNVTTQHRRVANALLKASRTPGVAEAVALLRSAYNQRISVDYDTDFQPDAALAADALGNARRFIDLCRAEFGLGSDSAAQEDRGPSP